jgi:hypothetical protein
MRAADEKLIINKLESKFNSFGSSVFILELHRHAILIFPRAKVTTVYWEVVVGLVLFHSNTKVIPKAYWVNIP